jgi:hypothetical protein
MDSLIKNIELLKKILKEGNLTAQEDKEIYAELCELERQLKECEIKNGVSMYGSYFSS